MHKVFTRVYLKNQKCWKIRWKVMDARRESAAILSYCKGDGRSRRRFSVEFNSIEDFSDTP